MMRNRILPLALAVMAFAALAVSCGRSTPPPKAEPSSPPVSETPTPPSQAETGDMVRLYLVKGERIAVDGAELTARGEGLESLVDATLKALIRQPLSSAGAALGNAVPIDTQVNGVEISGDTAVVDLSSEFEAGGGSLSMQLRVAQVVYTVTQFEGIERVGFKIDGQRVTAIGGEGVSVEPPLTRADCENVVPAILIESPLPGATVTSPLSASGNSNTFEATHQLELLDANKKVLAEKTVTATSGTGTRGTWAAEMTFEPSSSEGGYLVAYESSAQDGSRINVVEIPIRFGP